jgi:hypothetical protein
MNSMPKTARRRRADELELIASIPGMAATETCYGAGECRLTPSWVKGDRIHRQNASIFVPKTEQGHDADNLPCMLARRRAVRVTERVNVVLSRRGQNGQNSPQNAGKIHVENDMAPQSR